MIIKYKTIYDFILTSVKEKQILNAFKEFIKKTSDLNKLIFATCNNKDLISLLNEFYKVSMMKWKTKNTSVNKLIK